MSSSHSKSSKTVHVWSPHLDYSWTLTHVVLVSSPAGLRPPSCVLDYHSMSRTSISDLTPQGFLATVPFLFLPKVSKPTSFLGTAHVLPLPEPSSKLPIGAARHGMMSYTTIYGNYLACHHNKIKLLGDKPCLTLPLSPTGVQHLIWRLEDLR